MPTIMVHHLTGLASRHQWEGCVDQSWLSSKPIDQQNPHKIHLQRAESIISEGGVITEKPNV